ncbi:hypothetical protein N7455_011462 [Penicillium solitum]|uniref:uncharacterized protein n=1 Tax=Penicillium solitum TaxID=60172 RepID=UPI0032C42CBA|nr:hypothetical protein N7455_011462 [Penicillium solitum]
MSSRTALKDHSSPLPVCDSCFSRKVRCDRGNPCGNCQDNDTTCTRQRVMKRTKNSSQLAVVKNRSRTRPKSPQVTSTPQDPQISPPGPSDHSATTPSTYPRLDYQQSHGEPPGSDKPLSLHDAHATIQYQLDNLKWPAINRRQILESGLGLASQLSESFGDPVQVVSDITVNEEQIRTPSFELLTWMLKDINEATLGSFVRDYFRHVSEATLKQMGLNLLHRTGSPHDLLISTVCVNGMASRFLTAITTTGIDSELIHEMTHSVVQFQAAAKVALRSIPLLTNPSLALLQALISGIFLHQGSGDITVCWELTKAACRISSPYPTWRGLDAQSEISALQFAYHSIMTTIFHITEGARDQSIDIRKQCLLEAHQGISSLVSICISAERQNTVALLHWTLLVYPITAYFVLFCNVIATLDTDDFKLMTTIIDCLTRIETTSRPIIQVRTIFQQFLSLAGEAFDDESNATGSSQDHQLQSQSTTLQPWMPDDLFLPSTADAVSPFSPSLLAGMENFSEIPFFPENEMFIPFGDHFPDFGKDPSI